MIKIIRNSQSRGFTLIEFLFVAFTLALFLTALFNITTGGLRAYQRGVVQTELKHELRNIVDRVTTDVRQALPTSFTLPDYTCQFRDTMQFRRHQYEADNSIPESNTQITYFIDATKTLDTAVNHMIYGPLTRSEMAGSTTTTQTLSENVVMAGNFGGQVRVPSGFRFISYPGYDELYPIAPPMPNRQVIQARLYIFRTHAGSSEPEVIETQTNIAIRSDKDILSNSDYYPPTLEIDPTANIQRFGSPTSLTRP